MGTNAKNYEHFTYDEFGNLQAEEQRFRLEYDNGNIYYMPPVYPNHDRVKNKIATSLVNFLGYEGPCEVFTSDVAVVFEIKNEKYEYKPDIMICCEPHKFKGAKYKGIPKLIVEILSYTTQERDKGIKLDVYKKFGVDEYWVININEKQVTIYNNNMKGGYMSCNNYFSGMVIQSMIGFSIKVEDVFSVLR